MLRSARSMNSDGRKIVGSEREALRARCAGASRASAASTRSRHDLGVRAELRRDHDHEPALAVHAALAEPRRRRLHHPAEIAEPERRRRPAPARLPAPSAVRRRAPAPRRAP